MWWWADPVAALLIVPYVLWQDWDAIHEARPSDSKTDETSSANTSS